MKNYYILSVKCSKGIGVNGSIQKPCYKCKEMVWISPSLQNEEVKPICGECFAEKGLKKPKFILKKETIKEYIQYLMFNKAM